MQICLKSGGWKESQGRCEAACGQMSPEDFIGIYQVPGSIMAASQDTIHLMALPFGLPDWG